MKKLATLLLGLLICTSGFGFEWNDLPNQLKVTQNLISLTLGFEIKTQENKKLGTLYRRLLKLTPHYELTDTNGNRLAIARSNFYLFSAHFDIYDANEQFLGMIDEDFLSLLPSFELFGPDGHVKLADAIMNIWGTQFQVFDPETHQEIARMTRPFFRIKNDWTIDIENRELMQKKAINPDLLLTVLAFQTDKEAWKKRRDNQYSLRHEMSLSEDELANLAHSLEERFELDLTHDAEMNAKKFKELCLARLNEADVSDTEKQAIRYLLNL